MIGGDSEIGALWAAVTEGALFQIQLPGRTSIPASLGLRGSEAHAAAEKRTECAMGDYARLWEAESSLDLCFVSLAVTFLLYYFAVMGIHQKLHYAGDPSLAVNVRCARQDWSDPARPGGGVPVVGGTGFWWRALRPCLLLPWHLQCLVLGTGRPHRSAVCRSACGSVVEKDGLME